MSATQTEIIEVPPPEGQVKALPIWFEKGTSFELLADILLITLLSALKTIFDTLVVDYAYNSQKPHKMRGIYRRDGSRVVFGLKVYKDAVGKYVVVFQKRNSFDCGMTFSHFYNLVLEHLHASSIILRRYGSEEQYAPSPDKRFNFMIQSLLDFGDMPPLPKYDIAGACNRLFSNGMPVQYIDVQREVLQALASIKRDCMLPLTLEIIALLRLVLTTFLGSEDNLVQEYTSDLYANLIKYELAPSFDTPELVSKLREILAQLDVLEYRYMKRIATGILKSLPSQQ